MSDRRRAQTMTNDDEDPPSNLPDLWSPSARAEDDRPSALDRLLLNRFLHCGLFVGIIVGGTVLGLSPALLLLLAVATLSGPRIWTTVLFARLFRRGQFRRALFLANELSRQSRWRSHGDLWQLNVATCHIVLGELDQARQIADHIEPRGLSSLAGWVLRCNLAALHLKMGDPKRAKATLDEADASTVPAPARPYYLVNRAAALALMGCYDSALTTLAQLSDLRPPEAVLASALSLKAHVLVEMSGDLPAALGFSQEAVRRIGKKVRVQPQILVTHARILLESTGDEKACLDVLSRVVDYESEMGLVTRAELYYLLALCTHACGMIEDATRYILQAGELPCPPYLSRRVYAVVGKLQESMAGLLSASGEASDRTRTEGVGAGTGGDAGTAVGADGAQPASVRGRCDF